MRPPDFVIGDPARPYLLRWWLIPRNRWFNVYLHCILRSDDDRALHDHPWWNVSIVLRGGYWEVLPWSQYQAGLDDTLGRTQRRWRKPGAFVFRSANFRHRLEVGNTPCWSLFITGSRIREWGFHCPRGWVHWKDFVRVGAPGEIGPGCGS